MKILLSAFACHPGLGSEPNVGWQTALQISRYHHVTVLTDSHNKGGIVRYLTSNDASNIAFLYIQLPAVLRWFASRRLLHHLYYVAWQAKVFLFARYLTRREHFDLVHHLTYVNSWLPTFMGFIGIPFIWSAGPQELTPWRFLRYMSRSAAVSEVFRGVIVSFVGSVTRWIVGSKAKLVLSSSPISLWSSTIPVKRFPIGGLTEQELFDLGAQRVRTTKMFRLASIGKLLGLKGFALGIHAFAQMLQTAPDSEYWIIGDGPEEKYLVELARKLGCGDSVVFLGWRSREEVFHRLGDIDVLLHPSFHEQFGYAMVEAMASATPIVCLDVGANSLIVGNRAGKRIPITSEAQTIRELSSALSSLYLNRDELEEIGRAARQRAQSLWDWDYVGAELVRIYEGVA